MISVVLDLETLIQGSDSILERFKSVINQYSGRLKLAVLDHITSAPTYHMPIVKLAKLFRAAGVSGHPLHTHIKFLISVDATNHDQWQKTTQQVWISFKLFNQLECTWREGELDNSQYRLTIKDNIRSSVLQGSNVLILDFASRLHWGSMILASSCLSVESYTLFDSFAAYDTSNHFEDRHICL